MSAHQVTVSPACVRLAAALEEAGAPIYVVGGGVRNPLLGLAVSDTDICGPQRPEELTKLQIPRVRITDPVNGLGTAVVCVREVGEDAERFEYTAFRKDSYVPDGTHRPAEVVFTTDIAEDAARRDFTINALYASPSTGTVVDPLGYGLPDLDSRTLRMVRAQTMDEDALRILRMVRFACELDFAIEPGTFAAAQQNVPKLAQISGERIQSEFFRILLSDARYGNANGPLRGLFMLKDLGALSYIIPELMEGAGFAQKPKYHKYDVLDHQLHTCACAPPDLTTRLAALLHDISKPEVYLRDGNFHAHPTAGSVKAGEALARLRVPNALRDDVCALIGEHMFDLDNRAREPAVRRRILSLGKEQFQRLINLRVADFHGSGLGHDPSSARKWRGILDKMCDSNAPVRIRDLAIDGYDLMRELGMQPGPQIREMLDKLLLYAAGKPGQNTYKCLLKYARMIHRKGS